MSSDSLAVAIAKLISQHTGQPHCEVASIRPVSGGCINEAFQVTLADGREFFAKANSSSGSLQNFEAEVSGLSSLAETGTARTPKVIGWGSDDGTGLLVLEWIESGKPVADFFETLGRQIAKLHQTHVGSRFGFEHDNFVGATAQPNSWSACWREFWAKQRLDFQLKLAVQNGVGNRQLQKLGERLVGRLDKLLAVDDERPSLIHGDLWSGNFLVDEKGGPVLIDPAAYFAHREAEFGMTTLFGGFDSNFYHAYNEAYPLADGSTDRIAIYRLYHLLNHLNLFGNSYLDGCLQILKKYT